VKERESESIEKRFVALLNSDEDDLPLHLRHAVSLLAAASIPLDWTRLLLDVQAWGHPERYVQRQWSRDFWGASAPESETPSPEPASEKR
jgi:CRISPR system Cascade subunit CasB